MARAAGSPGSTSSPSTSSVTTRHAAHAGRHAAHTGGHRLEQRDRQPLVARASAQHVEAGEQVGDVVAPPEHRHAALELELVDGPAQVTLERP